MSIKNDVLEVIKKRRSIRKFKPEQIKKDELEAVLEAGTFAPTGGGAQSPVIVAVQNPAAIAELVKMNAAILGSSGNPYYGAPTIVLALASPKARATYVEDASCVLQNMMLAAHAIGLGSCWIHREKEMFSSAEGKALLKQWGISEEFVGVGSIALGYPDCEFPAAAKRKDGYIVKV
ncbi:MAG: nitroreductase [Spirochaetales bacterium]|jgi:nitroreductase|nr:nitroreductase [Spirochaetales bacterium]